MTKVKKDGRRGNAIIEVTFLAPWIFFLFVGVLDFGFYAYALISVENAARVAVLDTSQSSTAAGFGTAQDLADANDVACTDVKRELATMPNVGLFYPQQGCGGNTLQVVATPIASGADGAMASSVAVTYRTLPLIPIPGLLPNQLTITRTVQMKVKEV